MFLLFFFFNDTATTEIYTLSLHDALPIWDRIRRHDQRERALPLRHARRRPRHRDPRECERGGVGLDLRRRLRGVLPRDAHREDEAPLQLHDRLGERAARARVLQRRHQAVPPRAAQGEMTMNYGLVLLSLVTASATSLAAQGDFHWRGKKGARHENPNK